jgi:serine/threonine-protein kinase
MARILRLVQGVPPGPVLAVVAIIGLWAMSNASNAIARVPDLQGAPAHGARSTAAKDGYTVVFELVRGPGVGGTVVGQDPPPGAFLARGSAIAVRITRGKPQVVVPNVAGMPVGQARDVLSRAGVRPGDISYRAAPGSEPNRVIATDPPAGTKVDIGARVDLIAAA